MADPGATPHAQRALDAQALRRVRQRMMKAPEPPWLHAEVARRMAARLPIIVRKPQVVLDWWSAAGASAEPLAAAYPKARRIAVEDEPAPAPSAPPWWSPRRLRQAQIPASAAAALAPGAADMVWANMMLHWVDDPLLEMRRWAGALAVDGVLFFSTLGPGSLASLRSLYGGQGWPAPFAPFVDMHDLGDMLVQAGFADPVMDQETITLTWADPSALLAELRSLGRNVGPARHRGLRTPRWRDRLLRLLQTAAPERPKLAFEIVYGHAVRARPRVPVQGRTTVELQDMRSMLRGHRPI